MDRSLPVTSQRQTAEWCQESGWRRRAVEVNRHPFEKSLSQAQLQHR